MGKMKTDRMVAQQQLRKAQAMAESFAVVKTPEFYKMFREKSQLEALDAPTTDEGKKQVADAFGGVIALAYAMGFMDCAQSKTLKQLYVPQGTEDAQDPKITEEPSNLILPGSAKW